MTLHFTGQMVRKLEEQTGYPLTPSAAAAAAPITALAITLGTNSLSVTLSTSKRVYASLAHLSCLRPQKTKTKQTGSREEAGK